VVQTKVCRAVRTQPAPTSFWRFPRWQAEKVIGKKKGTGAERNHAGKAWELRQEGIISPKALIRARENWTRTWTHRAMVRPHANQNLVMLHTLKGSVPIPCGSNTQDFDANPFSVRGSCLKPSTSRRHDKKQDLKENVKRHASRCEAAH